MKENKIKQSETIWIERSKIKLANYNPRKISEDAKKLLKENLKRVGALGGIVWNKTTGNLVSGHQKVSIMDEANKYNDGGNDYLLKVEVVSLSEKQEKEQNLFMNNRSAQGEYDTDMLKDIVSDIDYKLAGFNDFEIELIMPEVVELTEVENQKWDVRNSDEKTKKIRDNELSKKEDNRIDRTINFYEDTDENKAKRNAEIAKVKARINNQNDEFNDGGMLSYVVLSFLNPKNKQSFMIRFGLNKNDKYIKGEDFSQIIERID